MPVVNNAAMNMGVHVSFSVSVFEIREQDASSFFLYSQDCVEMVVEHNGCGFLGEHGSFPAGPRMS